MELNPLAVIARPWLAVESAVEKPDFSKSFFLVLLPAIISLISSAVFLIVAGRPIEPVGLVLSAAKYFVLWFALSASIYFFAFLAKGKEMKGKFKAVYSSTAYIWYVLSIVLAIMLPISLAYNLEYVSEDFSVLALESGAGPASELPGMLTLILGIVLVVYIMLIYPFLVMKKLTKANAAYSFILYALAYSVFYLLAVVVTVLFTGLVSLL